MGKTTDDQEEDGAVSYEGIMPFFRVMTYVRLVETYVLRESKWIISSHLLSNYRAITTPMRTLLMKY
ncbi:hypothetical protein [Paenibacillus sp. UMB4589-SE434]|uniref:hypothetical protein n=1 Tax=Paenibacillus sp. UMB4589-SE434 TaxID=3046314 RepID=UPI0025516517|nr:hypothetical protein [Paenibacillus sp. UMB4589-SE434]MDK8181217.1 hypothetical protein [Paenibacillus sp. UMB4589-SE434]